jgi:hypothetical protein
MPAPRGNHNALKHGLYAKLFEPENLPEFKRMASDDPLQELAALRWSAMHALNTIKTTQDNKERIQAINAAVHALEAAANVIFRQQLLSAPSPLLQDLWDAIELANEKDGLGDAYKD